MADNSFFSEQSEASLVKASIISKYFFTWANVIISTQDIYKRGDRIAYIDLFAGPGRYEDGSDSTPCMILERAIKDPRISSRLVTLFNDKDTNNVKSLEKTIASIPDIEKLKYKPEINNEEVGEDIVKMFEDMRLVPTLFFVDPWGYKGLSLRLINSVLKDWGCDCIFFFNYSRINMGLSNPLVEQHMSALFGSEKVKELRERLKGESPENRELIIVEELCQSLKQFGNRFTLPFRFKNCSGSRTSHHLIFVSKAFKGYEIMKEIMWKQSSSCDDDGIGSFEYNPAGNLPKQSLLFQLSRPLSDLKEQLLTEFEGKVMTMSQIYEKHSVDKPFVKRNYKAALIELENERLLTVPKHRANTFADSLEVTFRRQE
ncbi:MAG: three-Cys-motif partner protein TcmP [Spirochaetes bacterium]|nr:three-Cys-motif partner protein TcmP [Spirochaetota bacterium]